MVQGARWKAWLPVVIVGAALAGGTAAITTAQADATPALQVVLTQVDGSAPFDADDDAGHDASPGNGVVRTNDSLTYRVTVTTGDVATDRTTIHLALPRGVQSQGLPSWCQPDTSSISPGTLPDPTLPVTSTSWEQLASQTLVCNLGTVDAATVTEYSFPTTVRPEVPNGTDLAATAQVVAADGSTAGAGPVHARVSARVRLDLTTWGMGATEATALRSGSHAACPFDTSRACSYVSLALLVTSPGGVAGTSPVAGDDLTITVDLDPTSLWGDRASLVDWSTDEAKQTYGARYVPSWSSCSLNNALNTLPDGAATLTGATTSTAVRSSGTVQCEQTEPGGPVTMTLTNPDTTLWTTPTRSRTPDQPLIDQSRGYVASVTVRVWVPYDAVALMGTVGSTSTTLPTAITATLDPVTDIGGLSNVADTRPDDTNTHTLSSSTVSGWSSFIAGAPWNPDATPAATFRPSWTTHVGPVGSTTARRGDGTVAPGEQILATTYYVNQMPVGAPGAGRLLCTTWDPNQLSLARSPVTRSDVATWPSGFVDGSGASAAPAGQAAWWTRLRVGAAAQTSIQYGHKASIGNGTASTCDDSTAWYDTPDEVPGNDPAQAQDGVYTAVNAVRSYVYAEPDVSASEFAFFSVVLQARATTFAGGSLLGAYVPVRFSSAGAVASQVGSAAGATITDVAAAPWSQTPTSFTAGTGTPISTGDWVRVTDGQATVTAQTYDARSGTWGSTTSVAAGDSARFLLAPAYTSSVQGTAARAATLTVCLPAGVRYASASPSAASVATGTQTCGEDQQTVTWNLGSFTPNQPLPQVVLDTTVTWAAANGTADVTAVAQVDYDWTSTAQRTGITHLSINSPSVVTLSMTAAEPVVDVVGDGTARTLRWDVVARNGGTTLTGLDLIDVLPDGSTSSGTLALDEVTASRGTVLYTSAAAVDPDPDDPSNAADGTTTWCDAPAGGSVVSGSGGCPTAAGTVTAVRVQDPGTFAPDAVLTVAVTVAVEGNTALVDGSPSRYVSTAVARLGGLGGRLGPTSATVSVTSASLGDRVWADLDGNGLQDAGEPGVGGVPVSLTGTDDLGNEVDVSTVTDATGHYELTGLPAGDYTLSVDGQGARFTTTRAGDDPLVSSVADAKGRADLSLASGQVLTDADVGLLPVTVSGLAWDDNDGDGIRTADGGPDCRGESPMEGVGVTLSGSDVYGTVVVVRTTTTASGYEFTGVLPGTYRVTFSDPERYLTSPGGQTSDDTLDSDGTTSLTVGTTPVTHVDAGFHLPSGAVRLSAELVGDPSLVPVGTTAPVALRTCSASTVVNLPMDGSSVTMSFPAGTLVTVDGAEPDQIPGTTWAPAEVSTGTVSVVSGASEAVAVRQTLRQDGGFSVTPVLTGTGAAKAAEADLGLSWSATVDGAERTGVLDLSVDEPTRGPDLPEGTVVTFGGTVHPVDDDTLTWGAPTIDPGSVEVTGGGLTPVTVVQPTTRATTTVRVGVRVTGDAASWVPEGTTVPVRWSYVADDGRPITGVLDVDVAAEAVDGPQVPTGTEVTFALTAPDPVPGLRYTEPEPTSLVGPGTAVLDLGAAPVTGAVVLHPALTGTGAADVTGTFSVPWTLHRADGTTTHGTLSVAPGRDATLDTEVREGDSIELGTVTPPQVPHVTWGAVQVDPASLTATDGEQTVELSAVATRVTGTLSLVADLAGTGLPALLDQGTTLPVTWSATVDGQVRSGTLALLADGTAVDGPTLPEGTEVGLAVGAPPSVAGCDWGSLALSATTVSVGSDQQVALTGTVTARTAALPVRLTVTGTGAGLTSDEVTVSYRWTWAGTSGAGSVEVPADGSGMLPELPVGARATIDNLTLPAVAGATWGVAQPSDATVGQDAALGAQVPLTVDLGTFSIATVLAGNGSGLVPSGTTSVVHWAATVRGETTTGDLVVPVPGTVVGPDLPAGSVVRFSAEAPAATDALAWGPPQVPGEVVIGSASTTTATVTQAATVTTGSFSLRVVDPTGLLPRTVTVTYSASPGGTGTIDLPTDGTPVPGPVFPVGTVVTIGLPEKTGAAGTTWSQDNETQTTIAPDVVIAVVLAAELDPEELAATGMRPSDGVMVALGMFTVGMVMVFYVSRRRQMMLLTSKNRMLRGPSRALQRPAEGFAPSPDLEE